MYIAYEAYDIGAYSPKLLKASDVPENVSIFIVAVIMVCPCN